MRVRKDDKGRTYIDVGTRKGSKEELVRAYEHRSGSGNIHCELRVVKRGHGSPPSDWTTAVGSQEIDYFPELMNSQERGQYIAREGPERGEYYGVLKFLSATFDEDRLMKEWIDRILG